ncbi:MAG: hypothetical protein R3F20_00945 [Planctomycetota bacterium]
MQFGLDVFHQTETSLQAHMTCESDDGAARVFGLFNLHAPPTANAYGSVHLVDPDAIDDDVLPDLLSGLGEVVAEELDLVMTSAIVTSSCDPSDSGESLDDVELSLERHRPTPHSTRDLLVDRRGARPVLVATLERFLDDDGSMSLLTVLDTRYHREDAAKMLLGLFDSQVGAPVGAGPHALDIIYADFLGEFGAQPVA